MGRSFIKDGRRSHPLYGTWQQMIQRCRNSKVRGYHRYGGRGISVCNRWTDFETGFWSFVEDMGPRPSCYQLDRIDNDGGYTPENCRWVSRKGQMANTSSARLLSHGGKTQPLKAWARDLGINHSTLHERLQRWPIEDALSTSKLEHRRI
jgi:hypothetical protein